MEAGGKEGKGAVVVEQQRCKTAIDIFVVSVMLGLV